MIPFPTAYKRASAQTAYMGWRLYVDVKMGAAVLYDEYNGVGRGTCVDRDGRAIPTINSSINQSIRRMIGRRIEQAFDMSFLIEEYDRSYLPSHYVQLSPHSNALLIRTQQVSSQVDLN